jgi:hypothetical protein
MVDKPKSSTYMKIRLGFLTESRLHAKSGTIPGEAPAFADAAASGITA